MNPPRECVSWQIQMKWRMNLPIECVSRRIQMKWGSEFAERECVTADSDEMGE